MASKFGETCEIRDVLAPSRTNNDHQDTIDQSELERKKKAKKQKKKDDSETEEACFVALVTESNLLKDTLYLPQDFTTLNGFHRKWRKIVLTNEGEVRSWTLKLRFNKSSETFYVKQGWRSFCNENGRKAGGFFIFHLMGDREIPVLVYDNRRRKECLEEASGRKEESLFIEISSEEEKNIEEEESSEHDEEEMEKKESNLRVKLTITSDTIRNCRLRLPIKFATENNIKPGMITLLGKDGIKHPTILQLEESSGSMKLRTGLNSFLKANGLKIGDSVTFKLIWEDTAPILCECNEEKTTSKKESPFPVESSGKEREKNLLMKCRDSTSPSQNRFVTLTLTHDKLRKSRLNLPLAFSRENGNTRPGMMTLLDKDGTKWLVNLQRDCNGRMTLGKGLKDFVEANGLKIGESFTLELIWENETPMLRFFSTTKSTTSDKRKEHGECSKAREKELVSIEEPSSVNKAREAKDNKEEWTYDSSSPIGNRFVTLTLTLEDVKACKLNLPSAFLKANGINKLGKITLLGQQNTEYFGHLLTKGGFVALGRDWKTFCEANDVKMEDSFTLEFIYEHDTNLVFKFSSNNSRD